MLFFILPATSSNVAALRGKGILGKPPKSNLDVKLLYHERHLKDDKACG
jgi:hypothetical protein